MAIYVVTHKEINIDLPNGYKTIIVNANVNKIAGDLYDNLNDNISLKNESYCELTAIYWIWKNQKDSIVGIDHYRRFFVNNNLLLDIKEAEIILQKYDAIVPEQEYFHRKMGFRFWTTSGYLKDLKIIRNVLLSSFPSYVSEYDCFLNQNMMYSYNMMVMKKKDFDDYCEWLFSILNEIEKYIDASKRRGYYKRFYGFVAERLYNVYILHNDLNVKELPILYIGEKAPVKYRIFMRLKKVIDKYRPGYM